MGQLITVIAPNGKVIQTNTYDADGRIISQLDAENSGVTFEYDLIGNRTLIKTKGEGKQSFEYDARGNIIGITDGENNETKYILDKWGKITGIEKADGSIEKYTYDFAGNITSSIDGENHKTEYIYNISGQLTTIIDPSGEKEQYFYDLENRLKEKVDRNGVITQYSYNMYQNLLYRKTKDNSLQEIYTYSKDGYLESAISNGMRYNYTYDIMGRIASKSASGRNLISYEYDKNGNKVKEIDVTGKITQFEYNDLDLLKDVSYNGNNIATYDYYNNGLIKNVKNGSIEQQYSYDKDLNLSSLNIKHNDELIVSNRYRYDGNGNRKSKQMFDSLTRYFYTEIGQLRKVKSENYEEELFYDKANNRTRRIVNGVEELYSYDNRNRLTKFTKNGQETKFKWDNAGNLLQDDKANYTYNDFNQTTKVETFDGNIQINRYDAEGLRYEMEENGQLVQFIFNTNREVLAEKENEWTIYIRGSELLASSNEYAKTYYHYANDEMGSITHIVDNKKILNQYEYDVWGNVVNQKETIKNRFKFNGQQLDPITQQYYLRARFYNPIIGRFTQEDTYRGDGLNLYAYCANNPIYYVDPSGHICEEWYKKLIEKRNKGKKLSRTERQSIKQYEKANKITNDVNNNFITYRRVQGSGSKDILLIDKDNNLYINPRWKKSQLNVSTGKDHSQYFKNLRNGDSYIIEFDVPKWLDDFINEYAIPQGNYRKNILNQGGMAPKIVDRTVFLKNGFEGVAYEIPAPIKDWLIEYSQNARIK